MESVVLLFAKHSLRKYLDKDRRTMEAENFVVKIIRQKRSKQFCEGPHRQFLKISYVDVCFVEKQSLSTSIVICMLH